MHSLFRKELWTKELFFWYLYDFANSFVYINTTLYFSQWVVVDNKLTDFWYSLPFILATIILIFTSSLVGHLGDRSGRHGRIFLWANLLAMASMTFLFLSGRLLPGGVGVIVALIFFGCYQLGYLLAFVPYNTFIKYLAPAGQYGVVSGIGIGFSELGNIAGLFLTLPIVRGTVHIFGTDRLAPLLPALLAFFIFSLPALFVFNKIKTPLPLRTELQVQWWKTFWSHLMGSRKIPQMFPLLISFYFFSDAILTVSLYSAIYLQKVFQVPDTTKVIMSISVLIGFALGAFVCGVISDRAGHRRTLVFSLIVNGLSIIGISIVSNAVFLYPLFVLFGFAAGGVYASSRSYLASLVPQGESGKFFGLYTFAERFASVIGPAIWGIVIILFSGIAPSNYRIAAGVMGVIALCGIIPFIKGPKVELKKV